MRTEVILSILASLSWTRAALLDTPSRRSNFAESEVSDTILETESGPFGVMASPSSSDVAAGDKILVRPRFIFARTRKEEEEPELAASNEAPQTVLDVVGEHHQRPGWSTASSSSGARTEAAESRSHSFTIDHRLPPTQDGLPDYGSPSTETQRRITGSTRTPRQPHHQVPTPVNVPGHAPKRPRRRKSSKRGGRGRAKIKNALNSSNSKAAGAQGSSAAGTDEHEEVAYNAEYGGSSSSDDTSDSDGYSSISTINDSSDSDTNGIDSGQYKARPPHYPALEGDKSKNRDKLYHDGLLVYLKDFHHGGLARRRRSLTS